MHNASVEDVVREHGNFGNMFEEQYDEDEILVLDLSEKNKELARIIDARVEVKDLYVKKRIKDAGAKLAIGRYLEDRRVYEWSSMFDGRTIHLGIDIFIPEGTAVFAFMDSTVHSIADNVSDGDYGPTIILEHLISGMRFYSLYGHLSRKSLAGKWDGRFIRRGERIGTIGSMYENGRWPEHLHFQLIKDMRGRRGDFPGVASREEKKKYASLCMDPNLVLGIAKL